MLNFRVKSDFCKVAHRSTLAQARNNLCCWASQQLSDFCLKFLLTKISFIRKETSSENKETESICFQLSLNIRRLLKRPVSRTTHPLVAHEADTRNYRRCSSSQVQNKHDLMVLPQNSLCFYCKHMG